MVSLAWRSRILAFTAATLAASWRHRSSPVFQEMLRSALPVSSDTFLYLFHVLMCLFLRTIYLIPMFSRVIFTVSLSSWSFGFPLFHTLFLRHVSSETVFFSSPFSLLTSFPSPCSAFPPFVIRRLHSVVCSWFFCPSQSSMELPETNVCLSLSIRVFVSEPEGSVPMNAVIIHPSGSSSGSILRKNSKNKSITLPQQVPSALQRVPHLRQ